MLSNYRTLSKNSGAYSWGSSVWKKKVHLLSSYQFMIVTICSLDPRFEWKRLRCCIYSFFGAWILQFDTSVCLDLWLIFDWDIWLVLLRDEIYLHESLSLGFNSFLCNLFEISLTVWISNFVAMIKLDLRFSFKNKLRGKFN